MIWKLLHPRARLEDLGFLPDMLFLTDSRPAKEQLNDNYSHGGGWQPFPGFRFDPETLTISYPGDLPLLPIAETTLRKERCILFESSWLLILQEDGSFEISRMN